MSREEITEADLQVSDLLVRNKKGFVPTKLNCRTILLNDPKLAGAICYNAMSCRIEIVKDMWWQRKSDALNDTDLAYIRCYFEKEYGITHEKNINDAITTVAHDNQFHPIKDYLNSLVWDGQERIRNALHHFLGADTSDLTYESLKLTMLGAVARVFEPGCKFETMLCLVGGQGVGKSTFFRFLAHNDQWFSDDLRNLSDEKVYQRLQGHWIIEMSEMTATASAKSIEDIKSFLGRLRDTYKQPYAVHPNDYPRQCIFAGTSNKIQFLPPDRSGNRRFLPIQCNANEAEVHILANPEESKQYIDQMWAEIMEIYRSGEYSLTLTPAMMKDLEELQTNYVPEDSEEAAILGYLNDPEKPPVRVCARQIYYEVLGHSENDYPKSRELNAINEIIASQPDWVRGPHARFGDLVGIQRSWVRKTPTEEEEFHPLTEYEQQELPFC